VTDSARFGIHHIPSYDQHEARISKQGYLCNNNYYKCSKNVQNKYMDIGTKTMQRHFRGSKIYKAGEEGGRSENRS